MRWGGAILLASIAAFSSVPVRADTASDCLQDNDNHLKLRACSDFIAGPATGQPQLSRAYAERGRANVALESPQAALADFDEAVRLDPDSGWALYLRAYLNRGQKQFDEAKRDFSASLAVARKGGRGQSAETTKSFVQELGNEIAQTQFGACRGASERKAMIGACTDYLAGGTGDPSDRALAFFQRGYLKLRDDDDAGALADYDASLALNPVSVDVLFYRGLLLSYLDHNGAALADYEKCLSIIAGWPQGSTKEDQDSVAKLSADLRNRADQARADDKLDRHWAAYLQEIQAAKTYPNWSGPPYDLYEKAMKR